MIRNSLFAVVFSVLVCCAYASAESIYFPLIMNGQTVPPANVQADQRMTQETAVQGFLWVAMGEGYINDYFASLPADAQPLAREIAQAMEENYVFSTQANVVRYFTHVYRTDSPDNPSLSPLPNKIEPLCRELALLLGADSLEPIIPDPVESATVERDEQ